MLVMEIVKVLPQEQRAAETHYPLFGWGLDITLMFSTYT
jgi:hypothetical protein